MRLLHIPIDDGLWEILKSASEKSGATPEEVSQHLLASGIESLNMPGEEAELCG